MGFNLVKQQEQVNITINDLSGQMMQDLIICYSVDIPPGDVEARYLLKERAGIEPDYPIIPANVISEFYIQLDIVKQTIIDIIVGNYHTGLYVDNRDGLWIWGNTPTGVTELKQTLFFIISRDFNENGNWIYQYTQGNFEVLRPFLDAVVDLSLTYTTGYDYSLFVDLIKTNYPFVQN
jgi:hypothetical protein